MIKRSPSRTQRSKGVKLKHVLQILLLVGVCFWLIYQIKHSHDKKKEYDEKESKVVRTQTALENFKLGRKDLPHEEGIRSEKTDEEEEEETRGDDEEMNHVEEVQDNNKHEDNDHDEENKHEELEQEEQNKHEEDDQEELDNKEVAAEDEGNAGEDDEIDERDQEKIVETDHDDAFVDEEKERADGADEVGADRENDIENENSSEDQDLDGGNLNSHEAREEHYKADDASSAVSHDTQTIGGESQNDTFEDRNQNSEKEVLQQKTQSNNTVYDSEFQENSRLTLGDGDKAENGTSLVVDSSERKSNENSTTKRGHNSGSNSTLIPLSDNQTVASNSSLEMNMEASNNAGSRMDASGSFLQNVTEVMNSTQPQNVTRDVETVGGVSDLRAAELEQANNSSNSTVPDRIENADATASNSSKANDSDVIIRSETTAGSDISSGSSSTINESPVASQNSPDASQNEKLDPNNEPGGIDEGLGSSAVNGTVDAIQHGAVHSSDSSVAQDIKEVRLDLDTLPDSRTGANNVEDASAE